MKCELESRELLSLCLKRLKGLNKVDTCRRAHLQVRLVDAGFIWTEPHSKRLKVKLTIQQEVAVCFYLIATGFLGSSASAGVCCRVRDWQPNVRSVPPTGGQGHVECCCTSPSESETGYHVRNIAGPT